MCLKSSNLTRINPKRKPNIYTWNDNFCHVNDVVLYLDILHLKSTCSLYHKLDIFQWYPTCTMYPYFINRKSSVLRSRICKVHVIERTWRFLAYKGTLLTYTNVFAIHVFSGFSDTALRTNYPLKKQNRKYRGVFKAKSREKTWQVREN